METNAVRVDLINPFVESAHSVFATMLGIEIQRGVLSLKSSAQPAHEISGIIGLSGLAKGSVVLSMSAELATEVTFILTGERCLEINADVIDAIGELTNMIAGSAKTKLEELKMSLGLPSVIAGRNHVVAFPSHAVPICIPFDSLHGAFCLEVCLVAVKQA